MTGALVGLGLGLVARAWLSTLRIRVLTHPSLRLERSRPWVLALWHGHLLLLLAHRRRRRTAALVSWSRDGEILRWGMRWFGLAAERGSSSRGGRAGLRAMVERLLGGWDGAFAVDGPRGPRRVARPGALCAARRAAGLVVPYAAACSWALRLRSWDRCEVPLPFSRVVVVLGEPISPTAQAVTSRCLAARIDAAARLAQSCLNGSDVRRPDADPDALADGGNVDEALELTYPGCGSP